MLSRKLRKTGNYLAELSTGGRVFFGVRIAGRRAQVNPRVITQIKPVNIKKLGFVFGVQIINEGLLESPGKEVAASIVGIDRLGVASKDANMPFPTLQ